jgi:hypothetical protein
MERRREKTIVRIGMQNNAGSLIFFAKNFP